ncbi:MAG: aminotransferase class V-fold PLP-dependent enzyme [Alphaproteobacteria bacterium]
MPNIYQRLGVRTIVNAKGPSTRVSGAIMPPQVAAAMQEASQHCVEMIELQGRANEIIAEITGAEAGYVTSGAAAGLLLGTAACVTGLDPGLMNRLPDTRGMRNEVVVPRSHRNFYDHAVRAAGVTLVEVGIADRFSGAGMRDTEPWEIVDAINERTAAVLYVAHPDALPTLSEVTRAVKPTGVPVIVDAAAQLPPRENLRRFVAEGADLVAFSGGKAIRGPQSSGILCGRRDLIASAALQNLDHDILFEMWNPPPSLFDKASMIGLPQHGIGRSCKVGKEEVVGLLIALRLFAEGDTEEEGRQWSAMAGEIQQGLQGFSQIRVELLRDCYRPGVPGVRVILDEQAAGMTVPEFIRKLQNGDPPIAVHQGGMREAVVDFNVICLKPGEPRIILLRMKELLG